MAVDSHAYVVDFESLMHNDDQIADHGASYTEGGFLFTNTATDAPSLATLGTQFVGGFAGSTALFNDNYEGQTVLTKVGGGTFNLNSISLAELFAADVQFGVQFNGLLANNATVSKTFTLDGILGFQDFTFGSDFSNLVSVSWNQTPDFHQFDNVNVTPTPIPAAAWLLGSGLAGLVGMRRRRNIA
jgi:hypothetical protein